MSRKLKWVVRCGSLGNTLSRHITKTAAKKAAAKRRNCHVVRIRWYRFRLKRKRKTRR